MIRIVTTEDMQALKYKFQTLKHMFQALKYMFQALKQKNDGTIADNLKNFLLFLWQCAENGVILQNLKKDTLLFIIYCIH